MNELKSRLMKELQQNFNVKICANKSWNLPVQVIEVTFETVIRTKMDILMKMMLIACQKSEIQTTEALSDILLVEPLFIDDLMDKMIHAQMIKYNHNIFVLTEFGKEQLKSGLFDHEPEVVTAEILYSPSHKTFLVGEFMPKSSEEVYRYHTEFTDAGLANIHESLILDTLEKEGYVKEKAHAQTIITKITSSVLKEVVWVPCLEFQLQNTEEDLFYARVWNTLSAKWDEQLETILNEQERKLWRERYKTE